MVVFACGACASKPACVLINGHAEISVIRHGCAVEFVGCSLLSVWFAGSNVSSVLQSFDVVFTLSLASCGFWSNSG